MHSRYILMFILLQYFHSMSLKRIYPHFVSTVPSLGHGVKLLCQGASCIELKYAASYFVCISSADEWASVSRLCLEVCLYSVRGEIRQ